MTCPECRGQMRIIAFLEDEEVIQKILRHLGLWEAKARPPPKVKAPSETIYLDDSESQDLPSDSFYAHPDYPMDSYRISKPQKVTSLVTISAGMLDF